MSLHQQKIILLAINVIAGGSVIASYIHGLLTHPDTRALLWGSVPQSLLPLYNISMITATIGYIIFTSYIIFFIDPDETAIAGIFNYSLFYWLYAVILVFSALWMPLTFVMLDKPSAGLWLAIRCTLGIVGLGSIGILAAIFTLQPGGPVWAQRSALIGCSFFCAQTAVLDALVWTAYFPSRL
jgi:hypothetical protein